MRNRLGLNRDATESKRDWRSNMATKKTNTVAENTDNITNISIEDGFQKLNELLNNMETEDIGLEASFDLYKQGVELVKVLNGKLDDVEGKLNEVNDVQ